MMPRDPIMTRPAHRTTDPVGPDMELILALKKGDPEEARLALDRGGDPNLSWNDGFHTPLNWVLANGLWKADPASCARLLLERGADPNGGAHAKTRHPLVAAVDSPKREAVADYVDMLLKAGADPNARDDAGLTVLMLCAKFDKASAVEVLLGGGADPLLADAKGRTALHWAISRGFPGPALALVSVSDLSARDAEGYCVAEVGQRPLPTTFNPEGSAQTSALIAEYLASMAEAAELKKNTRDPRRVSKRTL